MKQKDKISNNNNDVKCLKLLRENCEGVLVTITQSITNLTYIQWTIQNTIESLIKTIDKSS